MPRSMPSARNADVPQGEHPFPVTAVIVTYGDRRELVERTIALASEAGAAHVVVIDNAATQTTSTTLRTLAASHPWLTVHSLPCNTGSAGGFAEGIVVALKTRPSAIWLLDDDNWVQPDALEQCLATLGKILPNRQDRVVAIAGRRLPLDGRGQNDTESLDRAVSGPGSFMYFDAIARLGALLRRPFRGVMSEQSNPITPIPYAPYGGLLLTREAVEQIGLPDTRLFLYEDDSEYTARIQQCGGILVRCRTAVILDAEGKWSDGSGNGVQRLLKSAPLDRFTFAVRNRSEFDRRMVRNSRDFLRYALSRATYTMYVAWECLWMRTPSTFWQFLRLTHAGSLSARRLGPIRPLGLTSRTLSQSC